MEIKPKRKPWFRPKMAKSKNNDRWNLRKEKMGIQLHYIKCTQVRKSEDSEDFTNAADSSSFPTRADELAPCTASFVPNVSPQWPLFAPPFSESAPDTSS